MTLRAVFNRVRPERRNRMCKQYMRFLGTVQSRIKVAQ